MTDDDQDDQPSSRNQTYGPENTGPDGSYIIGKGRPPDSGKFRANDGRRRGKRAQGVRNLETDFLEEMRDKVTVSVNGKPKRVSRQRAMVMRLLDNAGRGQNSALKMVFDFKERFADNLDRSASPPDEEMTICAHLHELSPEELEQLYRLLHKAMGIVEAPAPDSPLTYVRDPTDDRNYLHEMTVDGISYRRCIIPQIPDEIVHIESRAYYRAALPRRAGATDAATRV